jgi:hypothetical protein
MPKVNPSKVEDGTGFTPLPPGTYPCVLRGIEPKETRGGDEMWSLRWEVAKGEYAGRLIFDNMVFSTAALPRVKLIMARVGGIDVTLDEDIELTRDMFIDKAANVTVEVSEYEGKERNSVTFDGYEARDENEDELPF